MPDSTFHRQRYSLQTTTHRRAFTLIELLVVITVISILVGLTIPAVQSVRRRAQNVSCKNNLRNIGLAVLNYESSRKSFPTSFDVPPGTTVRGSWSIHAKIMPFVEETNSYVKIDFDTDWHLQVATGVPAHAVPVYNCPSEINSETRTLGGAPYVHGTNYSFNLGSWLIHDPATGETGDGSFRVNKRTRPRDFRDGTSHTLCAAEVKAYTSYIRNVDSIDPTYPDTYDFFEGVTGQLKLGSLPDSNTGHTVWCDGRVHHTGFTTVYPPNTNVTYTSGGQIYDIDYTSQQEGRDLTRPTYAAVTSRSYHESSVNILNMDGAVHTIPDSISHDIWVSMGTAAGGEIDSAEFLR